MSTLAKNLKDVNGNVILPKTRSEQVYRPDNTTVETALANMGTIDKNSTIHVGVHSKAGTVHTITVSDPVDNSGFIYITFQAMADYTANDTFSITFNSTTTLTCNAKDYALNPPTTGTFKTGGTVFMIVDTARNMCFFKSRGLSVPTPDNPPDPSTYKLLTVYAGNATWTVPESNWYQIFVAGRGANGTTGGSGTKGNFNRETNGRAGSGGAGGGGGGVATSRLFFNKGQTVAVTVNTSMSSFGGYCSAYAGSGSSGGSASGGNVSNLNGSSGSAGTAGGTGRSYPGGNGGRGGYTASFKYRTGTVGSGGTGGQSSINSSTSSGAAKGDDGSPGTSATQWSGNSPRLGGGGGGGGGGCGLYWSDSGYSSSKPGYGGAGGSGSPGAVIIEKSNIV